MNSEPMHFADVQESTLVDRQDAFNERIGYFLRDILRRHSFFALLYKGRRQGFFEKIRFERYTHSSTGLSVDQGKSHFIEITLFNIGFAVSAAGSGHNAVQKTPRGMPLAGLGNHKKLFIL